MQYFGWIRCITARTAAQGFAITDVALGVVTFVYIVALVANASKVGLTIYAVLVFALLVIIVYVSFGVLLFLGIKKGNLGYIKAYLCFKVVALVIQVIFAITLFHLELTQAKEIVHHFYWKLLFAVAGRLFQIYIVHRTFVETRDTLQHQEEVMGKIDNTISPYHVHFMRTQQKQNTASQLSEND